MKKDFKKFVEKIYNHCSAETCYPKVASDWREDNKFYGHCAVVSLLIQDCFGGKILKCNLQEENISHYYNEIDGKVVDATITQYNYTPTKTNMQYVERNEILNNVNTLKRYETLKELVK